MKNEMHSLHEDLTTGGKQAGDGLNQEYWNDRYLKKETGWDLKEVSPPLKKYLDQCVSKELKILIPGAGNAHEAHYLVQQGFADITVVDIAPAVVQALQLQFQNNPHIQIIHSDFFELEGSYDLILEQTFFCALSPSLRIKYVNKMHQLLRPTGKLVGLLFNKEFEGGPPFGGNRALYEDLFDTYFHYRTLETCYNSVEPRAGFELFFIFTKK